MSALSSVSEPAAVCRGREEDPAAVGGHAGEEHAVARGRRQVHRGGRGADVHVGVPVVVAVGVGGDLLADHDPRRRPRRCRAAGACRRSSASRRSSLRRACIGAGREVAVVDRAARGCRRPRTPSFGREDEVRAVVESGFATLLADRGCAGCTAAGDALFDRLPSGAAQRDVGRAVGEAGVADVFAAEGEVARLANRSRAAASRRRRSVIPSAGRPT